jgi:indole-3-glycerol phosphate synthase
MSTVLERILESTREQLKRRKRVRSPEELEYQAFSIGGSGEVNPRRFRTALQEAGIGVIAEFKRRSPSAGALREAPDLHEMVGAYERGGASALSVLTEGPELRRLARRSASGTSRVRVADPTQGLHHRRVPAV